MQRLTRRVVAGAVAYQMLGCMAMDVNRVRAAVVIVHDKLDDRSVRKNVSVGIHAIDLGEDRFVSCAEGSIKSRHFLLEVRDVVEPSSITSSVRRSARRRQVSPHLF